MKIKLILLLTLLLLIFEAKNANAAVIPSEKVIVKPNIIVSATIGIPKMKLWGYGAPNATLELSGIGVDQSTTSQSDGYYSFDLIYLPDRESFPELCVTIIDQEKRVTPPTCIPPITAGNFFYDVGPVILPPTISLGAPQTHSGSQVSAQGATIPNSTIDIKLARPDDPKKGVFSFSIIETVLAYYIPRYSIASDAQGNYSFNMPTTEGKTWRVFAVTEYEGGAKSPKSNTLKFDTLTPAAYFWKKLLEFLKTFLTWPRILILEILVIIILLVIILLMVRRKSEKDHKHSNVVEQYQSYLESIKR